MRTTQRHSLELVLRHVASEWNEEAVADTSWKALALALDRNSLRDLRSAYEVYAKRLVAQLREPAPTGPLADRPGNRKVEALAQLARLGPLVTPHVAAVADCLDPSPAADTATASAKAEEGKSYSVSAVAAIVLAYVGAPAAPYAGRVAVLLREMLCDSTRVGVETRWRSSAADSVVLARVATSLGSLLYARAAVAAAELTGDLASGLCAEFAAAGFSGCDIEPQARGERLIAGLTGLLEAPSVPARLVACGGLGALGSSASQVVDRLVERVRDEDSVVARAAAEALSAIGSSACAPVGKLLRELLSEAPGCGQRGRTILLAVDILGYLGSASEWYASDLWLCLDEPSPLLRAKALRALQKVLPRCALAATGSSNSVRVLRFLWDDDADVRRAADSLLREVLPDGPSAATLRQLWAEFGAGRCWQEAAGLFALCPLASRSGSVADYGSDVRNAVKAFAAMPAAMQSSAAAAGVVIAPPAAATVLSAAADADAAAAAMTLTECLRRVRSDRMAMATLKAGVPGAMPGR